MSNKAEILEKLRGFASKWFNTKTCGIYAWIAFCVLFILLASNSAKLFWSFFSDYRGDASVSKTETKGKTEQHSFLNDILESKVFPVIPEKVAQLHRTAAQVASGQGAGSGTPAARPAEPQGPAKLPLEITGILASDHRSKSQVVIKFRNEEVLYGEGDAIEGTSARVSHIMDNRVEVFNSGRIDVYFLDPDNRVQTPPAPQRPAPNTTAANAPGGKGSGPGGRPAMGPQDKKDLADFMDYVSISPIKEGDAIRGYRLNPGKKPELFAKAGFRENDVAIRVNGYDLTNPEQAKKLFAEYATIENFEVTVERDGVTENIYLNINEASD